MNPPARGSAFAAAAIALLLGIPALTGTAQSQGSAPLSLKWAFIRVEADGQRRVVDFSKSPSVGSGERLQIYLEPVSRSYIFVFLLDSQKDLTLLYPDDARAPAAGGGDGAARLLPGEREWFTLDESRGEEQFYLIASAKRLKRLEDLTAAWERNPKSADAKALVLEEIKALRRSHSSAAAAVEKGVPMAGTFQSRSVAPDILGEATFVETREFYSKTLRLPHE
jgi:hypothetical protein